MSMVEGTWITGPIKPLIMFAKMARRPNDNETSVDVSFMTTVRAPKGSAIPANALLEGLAAQSLSVDVLRERHAWDPRVIDQLCRAIAANKPDIVETHQVKCHFLLGQALFWRKLKRDFTWIAFHHGYTKASLKLTLYEEIDRWSLRLPDQVVTVCRPFARQLIGRGAPAARTSVIQNAVQRLDPPPATMIAALRARHGFLPGQRVILAVGRLSKEKGHIHLVNAFTQLLRADPGAPYQLLIVGDGPERAALELAASHVPGRVHFAGHQADVWPYYFAADIFALPSLTEGSPLVLFEAMAASSAIVATRVGGVPETVVDGESAALVEPGDSVQLAATLRDLLVDSALRGRLASGAGAASVQYSPEAYRDRLLSLYHTVLDRPPGR